MVDPATGRRVMAEVIGLLDDVAVLTPIGDLFGLSSLTEVIPTGSELLAPVGEGLLGRVINALGDPIDGEPLPIGIATRPVTGTPPEPLSQGIIRDPIQLGIRAIDGLITCARGQRVGIFGEPGIGKSTLLADIVRGTDADVVVVGLIGERGREVREFIEHQLGPEGRKRAVIVVATSDSPAMERVKAAYAATAIAESFRDAGKQVLLLMDSLTRFARAQREIGLAAGEPPTRRGFPPSLFAALPRLVERAGLDGGGGRSPVFTLCWSKADRSRSRRRGGGIAARRSYGPLERTRSPQPFSRDRRLAQSQQTDGRHGAAAAPRRRRPHAPAHGTLRRRRAPPACRRVPKGQRPVGG